MMNWNHRVVRVFDHLDENGIAHYTLMFAEVYYNDDGTPMGHAECFMHGDDIGDLRQLVNRLADAVTHPILDEREMKDKRVPDSDEDIFEVDNARMSVPGGWLPGDECPLCGNAETCKECK